MIQSLVLIQGKNVKEQNLQISLQNALQLVIGNAPGFGIILHIAADAPEYLEKALIKFAEVPKVTAVITLMVRAT
ncbi:MAG: hypothetical protein ABI863_14535 [Ginsengibacter sp.]